MYKYDLFTQYNLAPETEKKIIEDFMNELKFYSVAEVADILKVNKNIVYESIRRGDLAAIRVNGRFSCYRIEAKDLHEFTASSAVVPYKARASVTADVLARSNTIRKLEAKHGVAAHG